MNNVDNNLKANHAREIAHTQTQNKLELEQKKRIHEGTIKGLKESNDKDLASITEENQRKIAREHQRKDEILKGIQENLARTEASLENQKKSQEEFSKNKLEVHNDNFQSTYANREDNAAAKIQEQNFRLKGVVEKNNQNFAIEEEKVRSQKIRELNQISKESTDQLTAKEKMYAQRQEYFDKTHDAKLRQQNEIQKRELDHLTTEHNNKVKLVTTQNEKEMNKLQTNTIAGLQEAQRQHEQKYTDHQKMQDTSFKFLNDQTSRELNSIKSKHALDSYKVQTRANDPFYRVNKFDYQVSETETDYIVKIKTEEHEKDFYLLSGEQRQLKLTFNRSYKDQVVDETNNKTTTARSESHTTQIPLEHIIDSKKISSEWADGTLSFKIKKA